MKIRLPRTFALLALCSVLVYAEQQATAHNPKPTKPKEGAKKEEPKHLAGAAKESRANLLEASTAYRASLEKLLELQRQDESRAAEMVGKRKELFALNQIAKRELEDGERVLAETQGRIAETIKRLAEVDQMVAEVNAAEELATISAKRPGLYRSAELKAADSIYGQTTARLKVYIKVKSQKNEWQITSSLRRELNLRLKPYKHLFLFVFPAAQRENNPDLTFTVNERPDGLLALSINGNDPRVEIYHSDCERIANDIMMFTAVKARILEVGEDQALEEWATTIQNAYEKAVADKARKQKNGVNPTRSKTVKKP